MSVHSPSHVALYYAGVLTDGAMLAFILRRLRVSTVFLAPYEKLQRRLLKAALGLFGSADSAPRVQAILLVRQMALDLPQPALDNCLKVCWVPAHCQALVDLFVWTGGAHTI